jgi:hypothetical protein
MAVLVHTVTMLTAATAAVILSLLNHHHHHVVTAYYLPGVNPHNYEKGEVYVDSNMVCVAESNWFRTIKVFVVIPETVCGISCLNSVVKLGFVRHGNMLHNDTVFAIL